MIDFLIVGKGIAGSLLALELLKHDKTVKIIDDPSKPSSSSVAGGMVNPVTGKHLAKTWLAETLFPYLHQFYSELQTEFKSNFYHPTPIYRPYKNINQKEQFTKAIVKHKLENYCMESPSKYKAKGLIEDALGGIETSQGGWVNVPKMLKALDSKLHLHTINEHFEFTELHLKNLNFTYKGDHFQNIIFCEGYYAKYNPYFKWLPFNPVKGETLVASIDDYHITEIINQNSWILPLGNSKYRIGATYSWHELDFLPTAQGKAQLLEKINNYLLKKVHIEDHQAGVRPAVKDRRPIMGRHPQFKNIFIFNGLGTKGVSLAPYFSSQFVGYLLHQKELNPEVTINRFYTLY